MDINSLYDPEQIFHRLESAAEDWAQAQLVADQLEKMGEILMAKMQLEAKSEGNPVGMCKEIARARVEWETHIKGELIARNKADRAKARYRNMQALADARRTQESTMRTLAR